MTSRRRSPVAKPATTKSLRKRWRAKRDEFIIYEAHVDGWEYSYHFASVDPKSRWQVGPYSELATLTFDCTLTQPDSAQERECEVILSPQSGLLEAKQEHEYAPIGSMMTTGDALTIYVSVPIESINHIVTAAASGRLQRIDVVSTPLRYRKALVHSISLDTKTEE